MNINPLAPFMGHSPSGNEYMLSDHRKLKLSRYDLKIKPILLELLEYGLGQVALSNALNIRGVPTPSGKLQTVHSVRTTLERLGLTTTGK